MDSERNSKKNSYPNNLNEDVENNAELCKIKLPLVQSDIEMAYNSIRVKQDWMQKYKQWELTLFVALSGLALNKNINLTSYSILSVLLISLFWLMEAERARQSNGIGDKIKEQNKKLKEIKYNDFCNYISEWGFGTPMLTQLNLKEKRCKIIFNLFRPSRIFWHGALLFVTILINLFYYLPIIFKYLLSKNG